MEALDSKEIEAEARRLLRKQIEQSAWFRNGMTESERRVRIAQEVDAWWHLKIEEAMHRLRDRDTRKEIEKPEQSKVADPKVGKAAFK